MPHPSPLEHDLATCNVFAVYGTLKRGGSNHGVMQRAQGQFQGLARTATPYPLVIGKYPYLLDLPNRGFQVMVELYTIPQPQGVRRLDILEGHPTLYLRRIEPFILESGDTAHAWIYFLQRQDEPLDTLPCIECFPIDKQPESQHPKESSIVRKSKSRSFDSGNSGRDASPKRPRGGLLATGVKKIRSDRCPREQTPPSRWSYVVTLGLKTIAALSKATEQTVSRPAATS